MTMSTSPGLGPSPWISRSEYLSTLPRWRRLLAMCNWRPVFEIEQRTRQLEIVQLQIESEIEQLEKENARLAVLESKLDSLLRSADSCSPDPPEADFS